MLAHSKASCHYDGRRAEPHAVRQKPTKEKTLIRQETELAVPGNRGIARKAELCEPVN